MMISWIVASHDLRIMDSKLGLDLWDKYTYFNDEVILVKNGESITEAYAAGQDLAHREIRCYIHHDVRILDMGRLRSEIIEGTERNGIAGVIGSRSMVMPWWHGALLGSVKDRDRILNYGPGGECAVVDGLLLATRHRIAWDITWPGWHGYDYDACRQMVEAGIPNWCISNGHELVHHDSDSPYDLGQVDGWAEAIAFYQAKWDYPRG